MHIGTTAHTLWRRAGAALLAGLVTAALAAAGPTPLLSTAHAEVGYVKQKSSTYVPRDGENGGKPDEQCKGKVWIGYTQTGWIQAYSTLTCANPYGINSTETWITPARNSLKALAKKKTVCNKGDCSRSYAAVSIRAEPNKTYCVMGHGTYFWPGRSAFGGKTFCIST